MSQAAISEPAAVGSFDRQKLLAALAVVPILATVYQTLVLTDVTSDVIRKGIEADSYQMIWTNLAWGVAAIYGIFLGIWGMARFGQRLTMCAGLILFALGNLLCGASIDVPTLSAAKLVEGIGKGMSIMIGRSMLYRQFDRALITAVGFYGVAAYATRPTTPLITAYVNDWFSWRWIFWVNVPVTLLAIPMVWWFIRPDRPPTPRPLRIDWLSVTLLAVWISCVLFSFGWYRKWGGYSSNAFTTTATLSWILPFVLAGYVGSGLTPDEHLRRIVRVQPYLLAMAARTALLLNLAAVEAILSSYMTELRDYPRVDAGWVLAPASLAMATSTFLTTWFHRRRLREVWLLVGVLGTAGCVWWLSAIDNFTPREHVTAVHALWGLFLGLLPPAFLTDEVESLEPRDALYAGALAVLCVLITLCTVPVMTSTTIKAWSDRAFDSQRLNVSSERVAVGQAQAAIADSYRQRGLSGPELSAQTSTVIGTFVKLQSVSYGIQHGLKFLSLMMLGLGLPVVVLRHFLPPPQRLIPDPHPIPAAKRD